MIRSPRAQKRLRELPLHLMLIPGLMLILIFHYVPMFGIVMAFQNFKPAKGIFGSKWVGLENFIYIAKLPNMGSVLYNTVFIAVMKIIAGMIVPIFVALMLTEVSCSGFKRTVQTIVYFPHFLSWVILGGVLMAGAFVLLVVQESRTLMEPVWQTYMVLLTLVTVTFRLIWSTTTVALLTFSS